MHLRSIYRDGWLCTVYEPSTDGQPTGLETVLGDGVLRPCGIHYDGSEGELYQVDEDPHQFHNRWDDPALRALRDDPPRISTTACRARARSHSSSRRRPERRAR